LSSTKKRRIARKESTEDLYSSKDAESHGKEGEISKSWALRKKSSPVTKKKKRTARRRLRTGGKGQKGK